jgi:O-antigen/teichoic acid export membrane protein
MSTVKRLVSGSAAAWLRIFITFLSQILIVPVFLHYWDANEYGMWLSVFAYVGLASIISNSYQTYVGNEFLSLVHQDRKNVWKLFSSSCIVVVVISFIEVIVALGIVWLGILRATAGGSDEIARQGGIALIVQTSTLVFCNCMGGVAIRLLSALGYYARLAWWGVVSGIILAVAPVLAVIAGADIAGASIASCVALLIYNVAMCWDMWRILKREKLELCAFSQEIAWGSCKKSLALVVKTVLEMVRQQGTRIVLGPLSGASQVAAFATMRTGSNVVVQGLSTITNPMLPELMRFLHQRDQARSEAALGTVWLVAIWIMAPGLLVLQVIAPNLFALWTRGQIVFDPVLFALLSMGVLVVAVAQPAGSIVRGNNLLRGQVIISAISGVSVVVGMMLLVPRVGLIGAGISLLCAEIISAVGYTIIAARWLIRNGLHWPKSAYRCVLVSVSLSACGLIGAAVWPNFGRLIVMICLLGQLGAGLAYWNRLPSFARTRASRLIFSRLPLSLRNRFSV